jgi:uncharacterized protein (TIGR00369 family)
MPTFEPHDSEFAARVRSSFERQTVMATIAATLARVEPGEVEITLPYRMDLTQQHDFVHAGIIATVLDSACGYAAYTLMPSGGGVLTVEYKINLLAPAAGELFTATGKVVRPGRTLTVCRGEVTGANATVVAVMQATIMAITDRPAIEG